MFCHCESAEGGCGNLYFHYILENILSQIKQANRYDILGLMAIEGDGFMVGYLSISSIEVITTANFHARHHGQKAVGLEHLLYGVVRAKTPMAENVLSNLGITEERIEQALIKTEGGFSTSSPRRAIPLTPEAKEVLGLATGLAEEHKRLATPEDILLTSTMVPMTMRFGEVLHSLGVSYPQYRNFIQDIFRE